MPSPQRSFAAGDLVGLTDDGKIRLAVVAGTKGSRVDLRVGPEGKTLQRSMRQIERLLDLPNDVPPPARLGDPPWRLAPHNLNASLPPQRELGTAWLLLLEEDEPLNLQAFAEMLGDGDDPALLAACWSWLQGEQTLFRWRHETVAARSLLDLRRLRKERRKRQLVELATQHWQQILRQRQPIDAEALAPAQRQHLALLRRWAAGDKLDPLPDDLHRSLQAAHCQAEAGAIRHLLIDLGQWERHHLPSLDRTTWEEGFSQELLAEARRLVSVAEDPHPGDALRRDLCALHTVTIDDEDTRDIDDGLSLESLSDGGRRLWIHVADPDRLVPAGSPLDLEARRRATSLYLARGPLPMFPTELATGPMSLRMGQRSAAWSLWVDLADDGAIAASGIERSWVRPTYRLSYGDADELIELAPPQEKDLTEMHQRLQRRRRWRLARGALQLDQPEGRVRCEGDEALLVITEPSASRLMVAEAMILAGAVVAEHGCRHGLALPYRSQLPAELPSEQELEALPPGPVRHAAIKRCLVRGSGGATPAPHFSLGLNAYVQTTSPIRRYGDLLAQRQLRALQFEETPLGEGEVAELLDQLEGPIKQGILISREDQRHWLQVWFEGQRQPEWRAQFLRWLRPQDCLGLVHVDDLAMDLAAECPAGCQPADALVLRVRQVDSLQDLLKLQAVR